MQGALLRLRSAHASFRYHRPQLQVRLMTARPPAVLTARSCVLSVWSWLGRLNRLWLCCACAGCSSNSVSAKVKTGAVSAGRTLAGAAKTEGLQLCVRDGQRLAVAG